MAIYYKNLEIVRTLLEYKADPNTIDNYTSTTLLGEVTKISSCDMMRLLLDYKADINKTGYLGNTPLHVTAYRNTVKKALIY
jgi:ankyrin repeat protein